MKKIVLTLTTLVVPFGLTSCPGTSPSGSSLGTPLQAAGEGVASSLGAAQGEAQSKELDEYLAVPIKNKQIMEETGAKIKKEFASKPEVLTKGQRAYDDAVSALGLLRQGVKSDIVNKIKGGSDATKGYAQDYTAKVNALSQVYYDTTGMQPKSIGVLGVLGLIQSGFQFWSSYETSRTQALTNQVDRKLRAKNWAEL